MPYKILIDSGHAPGNTNRGATTYYEHAGMWNLSNHLKAALTQRGFFVALSRTENQNPSLTARGQAAKGFDLFISEHSNAANGKVRGVEVFYSVQVPKDRPLAATMSKAVSGLMGNSDRGAKTRPSTNNPNADYYTVMNSARKAGCPHVLLIESGFHDNPIDEAFLLKDENLKAIAETQAEVICEFFGVDCGGQANDPIAAMTALGVINTPEYWRTANVRYLDELFAKAVVPGVLDSRIENGITGLDTALTVMLDAGIINTAEYWRGVAGTVKYLTELLINIANRCRIVLEKLIHAEACGEALEGQILVGNVVMNRHKSRTFPDGIYNVVFQPGQFAPVTDGAYNRAVPSVSVKKAVDSVLNGTDNSRGALYFCTKASAANGNWHESALRFLFECGNHRFYI